MYIVTNEEFEQMINQALDELPKEYVERLNNVAIVTEDEPTEEQRQKLHLHFGQTLFGLYEGIPLTQRGNNYSLVLPDKIILFKKPLESTSRNKTELKANIKHTLWHEIAHFFGLDHDRIYRLDGTSTP